MKRYIIRELAYDSSNIFFRWSLLALSLCVTALHRGPRKAACRPEEPIQTTLGFVKFLHRSGGNPGVNYLTFYTFLLTFFGLSKQRPDSTLVFGVIVSLL